MFSAPTYHPKKEDCRGRFHHDIKSIYKKMMILAKAQAFKATKSAGALAT